jgi:EmrB/QacA subfamily drug resistance transporter
MPRGPRLTLATLLLATFMANLDSTIVNIALPTLGTAFGVDASRVATVSLAYLLALCGFLLLGGRLGDVRGPRAVLLGGYALFVGASVGCALAPGVGVLAACRFVQGVGGALLNATLGLVVVRFLPADDRGRAFGLITAAGAVGYALGAPVGGFLVQHLGWRAVFWVNVPIGAVGALLVVRALPREAPTREAGAPLDLPGLLLGLGALAAAIVALNQVQELGWRSPLVLGAAGASVAGFALFVARERRTRHPLLDLGLFANRDLALGLLAALGVVVLVDGLSFVMPFYFDRVLRLAPGPTGLYLGLFPLLALVASPLGGRLADRLGPRRVCAASAALAVLPCAWFLGLDAGTSRVLLVVAFVVFGTGVAAFFAASASLVMSHAAPGRSGMTSALLSLNQSLGAVLGVTLCETLYSSALPVGAAAALAPAARHAAGVQRAALLWTAVSVAALLLAAVARAAPAAAAPAEDAAAARPG